jgi:hypothetical protein
MIGHICFRGSICVTDTKRPISNETSQDIFLRLKNAANRSAAKISNEKLQEISIKLKNAAKRYAAKKSSETPPERASQLEKHYEPKPPPAWYNKMEKLDNRKRE